MRYVRTSKGTVFDTIQEGINDLSSEDGGWVEASVGTFTEDITIRQANITLRGQGYGTALGHVTYSRPAVILICGVGDQFVIKDIRVANVSSGTAIRVLAGAHGGLFDNVYISEAGQDGIQISGADFAKINDCTIAFFDRHAISLADSSGVIVVKNYMGMDYTSGCMINISGGGGHVISNNVFRNYGSNSGSAVIIGAGANNVTVTSNRMGGFSSSGFIDRGTNTVCGLNNIS